MGLLLKDLEWKRGKDYDEGTHPLHTFRVFHWHYGGRDDRWTVYETYPRANGRSWYALDRLAVQCIVYELTSGE